MNPRRRTLTLAFCAVPLALPLSGCLDALVKPEASVDSGLDVQLPPYDGPRARAAVTNFDWNIGSGRTTIGVGGTDFSFSNNEYAGYAEGLKDMLTTAMVQSKRYRVPERQNIDSVKDVNLGAALGALGGFGGSLGGFAGTPMEKAIRTCIAEATKFVVANTPASHMQY